MIIKSDNRKRINYTSVCYELPSFVVNVVTAFATLVVVEVVVMGVVVGFDGVAWKKKYVKQSL